MITNDASTWPSGDSLWTVAQAIARQEGYSSQGSAPLRYNNPGDLSRGDEHGQPVQGYTTLPDGEQLIIFSTAEAGWNALYAKLANILNGASSVYTSQMTWRDIGYKWASDPNWANGVAGLLGVDPGSTFASFFLPGPGSATAGPIDPGTGQIIQPGSDGSATDLTNAGGNSFSPWIWVGVAALGVFLISDLFE